MSGMTKWLLANILHQNSFWDTMQLYLDVVNLLYWILASTDYKKYYKKKLKVEKSLGAEKML